MPDMSDPRVVSAVAESNLAALSHARLEELLSGSRLVAIPAGSELHREGERAPHCEMVLVGLVRVFVRGHDGRTMTIRYCRRGSLIGVASLFGPAFALPASVQAVTGGELLRLSPDVVLAATARHPDVAQGFLSEVSERAMSFAAEVTWGTFAPVRQRVARHLLDLATTVVSGELVAQVSHQDLADAVGSVREVVVRVLRQLRQEGVVGTGRGRVAILDPEALLDVASPATGGNTG